MFKVKTIRARLLLNFVGISTGYFLLSSLLIFYLVHSHVRHISNANFNKIADYFKSITTANFVYYNYMALSTQAEDVLRGKSDDFIILFDANAAEIVFKGPPAVRRELSDFNPRNPLRDQKHFQVAGRRYFFKVMPVTIENSTKIWGYVAMGQSLEENILLIKRLGGFILLVTVVLMVLSLGLIYLVSSRLVRPLRVLKEGLETVGRGDFSCRIPISGHDEFAFLGGQFNEMTQQLESTLTEIETTQKDLEHQVALRTHELHESNRKLQEALQELKDTQRHIIQSEKQKSLTTLVSGFAHEINNPLTGILGYIDLIVIRNDVSPQVKEKLLNIQKQSMRIKNIIDQLSQLNPDIEQTKLEINLGNLLGKLLKVIHAKPENSDIRMELRGDEEEIVVFGNHFALWQVFEGIIENSLEAIHDGEITDGFVAIGVKRSVNGEQAVVEISDNGGGFKNLDKAFDPFYTTKSRTQKKGIGLSIAYNIIQEHRGTIMIGNNDTGGATVTVYLKTIRKNLRKPYSQGAGAPC